MLLIGRPTWLFFPPKLQYGRLFQFKIQEALQLEDGWMNDLRCEWFTRSTFTKPFNFCTAHERNSDVACAPQTLKIYEHLKTWPKLSPTSLSMYVESVDKHRQTRGRSLVYSLIPKLNKILEWPRHVIYLPKVCDKQPKCIQGGFGCHRAASR